MERFTPIPVEEREEQTVPSEEGEIFPEGEFVYINNPDGNEVSDWNLDVGHLDYPPLY